jgi:hypothetical protein
MDGHAMLAGMNTPNSPAIYRNNAALMMVVKPTFIMAASGRPPRYIFERASSRVKEAFKNPHANLNKLVF